MDNKFKPNFSYPSNIPNLFKQTDPNKISKFIKPVRVSNEIQIDSMKDTIESIERAKAEEKRRDREYKESVLDALLGIERNTAEISTLVALINQSNENQEKILEVINDIMSISTAKSKEEADSLFRNVMDKANQVTEDVETIDKLIGFGRLVWTSVKTYLSINHGMEI